MRNHTVVAWFIAGISLVCGNVQAADVTLKIDAGNPSHAISPRLVGIFLEDINFGADGGLNAELVKNGSFEFPQGLMGWSIELPGETQIGNSEVGRGEPAYPANPHYLRISAGESGKRSGIVNEGFRGMGVRAGDP